MQTFIESVSEKHAFETKSLTLKKGTVCLSETLVGLTSKPEKTEIPSLKSINGVAS